MFRRRRELHFHQLDQDARAGYVSNNSSGRGLFHIQRRNDSDFPCRLKLTWQMYGWKCWLRVGRAPSKEYGHGQIFHYKCRGKSSLSKHRLVSRSDILALDRIARTWSFGNSIYGITLCGPISKRKICWEKTWGCQVNLPIERMSLFESLCAEANLIHFTLVHLHS